VPPPFFLSFRIAHLKKIVNEKYSFKEVGDIVYKVLDDIEMLQGMKKQSRFARIDKILCKLYEDSAFGRIPKIHCEAISAQYKSDQRKI